jgi:hypothetical protein
MTTDLFFMLHLLDAMPNLRLTGDLSHYVVGREFWYPISDEDDAMMQRIINNCWGFHGRVASREQIQLQISLEILRCLMQQSPMLYLILKTQMSLICLLSAAAARSQEPMSLAVSVLSPDIQVQ